MIEFQILTKLIFLYIYIKLVVQLENKSISAIIVQKIFDYRKHILSKKVDTYKGVESFLSKKYKYLMGNPQKIFKRPVKEEFYNDMQVYSVNDLDDKNQTVFIYFYGSAYYRQITQLHLNTLKNIINRTNIKLVLPNYNKAYDHTYKEVYQKLLLLYRDMLKKHPATNICIGGDSSGGGLALGFTKFLRDNKIALPKKLFLFSPWVDVSFSNKQYKKYEKYEAYLDVKRLRDVGHCWAGGKDNTKNIYASPVYGDLKNLPNMHIFTGTNDIFYPDIRRLHKKLSKLNAKHAYLAMKNMVHAYNVFPIKEAKFVQNYIINELKRS